MIVMLLGAGLAGQHTRVYENDCNLQRGVFAQVKGKDVTVISTAFSF